jgi:hypothetical protein
LYKKCENFCVMWLFLLYDMSISSIWYDMMWCDYVLYDMSISSVWYDMMWYDIWYDMMWYDIWYDMMWYDVMWYDMMWCHMMSYDMMWYDCHMDSYRYLNDQYIHYNYY